jgi:hypothetical protein
LITPNNSKQESGHPQERWPPLALGLLFRKHYFKIFFKKCPGKEKQCLGIKERAFHFELFKALKNQLVKKPVVCRYKHLLDIPCAMGREDLLF